MLATDRRLGRARHRRRWTSVVIGLGVLIVGGVGVAASLRAQDDRAAGASGAAVVFGGHHRRVRGRPRRRGRLRHLPDDAMSADATRRSTTAGRGRSRPSSTRSARASTTTRFDAAVFSLESVVADLGYGDVRPLPGSVAWIDELRAEGKRIAVLYSGEGAERGARARRHRRPLRLDLDGPAFGRDDRAGLRVDRRRARSRRGGGRRPEGPRRRHARPGRCWRSRSRARRPPRRSCARAAPRPSSRTCRSCSVRSTASRRAEGRGRGQAACRAARTPSASSRAGASVVRRRARSARPVAASTASAAIASV